MKKIITKQIPIEYIKDGKFETPLNNFVSLLEELKDCDGIFNAMCIDTNDATYLVKKKIIVRTVRGSYAVKNENLRLKMLEELYKLKFGDEY